MMGDLQPDSLSFGTIFKYPQSVTYPEVRKWAESEGFDMDAQPEGGITMGQSGVQIDDPGTVGQKDNLQILFNPQANIEGLGETMFITVKDTSGADFESLITLSESLWRWLSENGYEEDIHLLELILQTRVRANNHNFTTFFDRSKFDTISDLGDQSVEGTTARFQGDGDKTEGWYQLLIDSKGHPNPRIWLLKLTQRLESIDEVAEEDIRQSLRDVVNLAEVTDDA
jgi:hypothetical protein